MEAGSRYPGAAVAGGVLATLFVPFLALIAALLLLQGGETNPRRREQLRNWAWISGSWLLLEVVASVVLALATL